MKAIPLSRGLHAVVSAEDYELVSSFVWHAKPVKKASEGYYASSKLRGKTIYMHRLILGAANGEMVDHKDGNGLNNVRTNLRLSNGSQNNANRSRTLNKSGFRGVCKHLRNLAAPYRAIIKFKGGRWAGPYRANAVQAAIDYDRKAIELWGEFARPNFPCIAKAKGEQA